jgi:hypothetical protein
VADSACDSGCQSVLSCGAPAKEKGGFGGGLFGAIAKKDGAGPHDRLAYEVITNFLTQQKLMRVVESHRHNYPGELNVETRKKIDIVTEKGTALGSMSCEDLCLLDEAKKRKSDKVLVYHILRMAEREMTIHYRLSDVATGIVEAAHTLKVIYPRVADVSMGPLASPGGAKLPAAED